MNFENSSTHESDLRLNEGLMDKELSDVYSRAVLKMTEYTKIQQEFNLTDADIKLLAAADNPFTLKQFTGQQILVLKEIKEKLNQIDK